MPIDCELRPRFHLFLFQTRIVEIDRNTTDHLSNDMNKLLQTRELSDFVIKVENDDDVHMIKVHKNITFGMSCRKHICFCVIISKSTQQDVPRFANRQKTKW